MGAVLDAQAYLEAEGIIGGSTGWTSLRRRIHDGDGRLNKIVAIGEDGGDAAEVKASAGIGDAAIGKPAVLITVRAEEYDGDASSTKAAEIFTALNGLSGTIGSNDYLVVHARTSEPVFVGYDERERPLHTISFVFMKLL
jgi:hypothetical protein